MATITIKPLTERPIGLLMPEWARATEKLKSQGLCPLCRRPALEHCHTDAGRREVRITGMCEECFDKLFAED